MTLALARPGTFDPKLAVLLDAPSRRSRLLAALLSLLILGCFLQLLMRPSTARFEGPGLRQAITVFLSPSKEVSQREEDPPPQFGKLSSLVISEPSFDFETATASAAIAQAPSPTPPPQGDSLDIPASPAPLQLGTDTLRAAMSNSKSQVQQLAEASGQDLGTPKRSKSDHFAASAEFAGKPGCLRPDALKFNPPKIGPVEVSGILVLPFMLQGPLMGKCV